MFKLSSLTKLGEVTKSKDTRTKILLLLFLLLVIFLRFLFIPDLKNLRKLSGEKRVFSDELNRKKTEYFSTEELLKNPQRYEEEYLQAENVLSSLEGKTKYLKNILIKKELVAEVLNYLTSGVNPDEVKFNLIRMEALVNREYFNELPIEIKITSDFYAFLHYIYSIESLPILIKIKQLKISSPESTGVLGVEANLIVYVNL